MCAIREDINQATGDNSTITPIDIAGTYKTQTGRDIDAKFELLRNSKSNSDAGKEGVRAELHGGRLPFDSKTGVDQQAIIEFVCDKERSGLEGDEKDNTEHEEDPKDGDAEKEENPDQKPESLQKRDDEKKGKCEDSDRSLRFCGYELEDSGKGKSVKTLRLEWRTKYACENAPRSDDSSSSLGFFGWFFIM